MLLEVSLTSCYVTAVTIGISVVVLIASTLFVKKFIQQQLKDPGRNEEKLVDTSEANTETVTTTTADVKPDKE